jgi:hypothetical protein
VYKSGPAHDSSHNIRQINLRQRASHPVTAGDITNRSARRSFPQGFVVSDLSNCLYKSLILIILFFANRF